MITFRVPDGRTDEDWQWDGGGGGGGGVLEI